jgi:hypothetical protein
VTVPRTPLAPAVAVVTVVSGGVVEVVGVVILVVGTGVVGTVVAGGTTTTGSEVSAVTTAVGPGPVVDVALRAATDVAPPHPARTIAASRAAR